MAKVWDSFFNEVNGFDKKIDATNPFSPDNYSQKKYSNFHEFYYPEKEHIIVWVEDDD
jgi:hypothetical protein